MESWEDKKDRLFKRDRYRCKRCQKESPGSLSLHHIIPRELYGSDDDENLITLCSPCHDWVELNFAFDPLLRTRIGIMNSIPVVQHRIIKSLDSIVQPGYPQLGDKADIWTLWVKQGRKGALELIEKYGSGVKTKHITIEEQQIIKKSPSIKAMSESEYKKMFKSAESNPLLKEILTKELNKKRG